MNFEPILEHDLLRESAHAVRISFFGVQIRCGFISEDNWRVPHKRPGHRILGSVPAPPVMTYDGRNLFSPELSIEVSGKNGKIRQFGHGKAVSVSGLRRDRAKLERHNYSGHFAA